MSQKTERVYKARALFGPFGPKLDRFRLEVLTTHLCTSQFLSVWAPWTPEPRLRRAPGACHHTVWKGARGTPRVARVHAGGASPMRPSRIWHLRCEARESVQRSFWGSVVQGNRVSRSLCPSISARQCDAPFLARASIAVHRVAHSLGSIISRAVVKRPEKSNTF